MPSTDDHTSAVIDLIAGRWRSQILYVGAALGTFDVFDGTEPLAIDVLGRRLGADHELLYRLLRALASIGLLVEASGRRFALAPQGALLRKDHPASLRAMALLEEGPVHYAVWKHLQEIVQSGQPDGFKREYNKPYFEYMRNDAAYARVFSEAMSSYSANEAPAIRFALRNHDFDGQVLCDIGGSAGALLREMLRDHTNTRAIVFDLPEVIAGVGRRASSAEESSSSLEFVGGDMFDEVPTADAYFLKHILHDWPDDDCIRILSVARRSAGPRSRLLICEMLVPGPGTSHFAKLIDIHMMVVQSGRQRTAEEIRSLLERSGWMLKDVHALDACPLGLLVAETR